jgi:hypothetical protein
MDCLWTHYGLIPKKSLKNPLAGVFVVAYNHWCVQERRRMLTQK